MNPDSGDLTSEDVIVLVILLAAILYAIVAGVFVGQQIKRWVAKGLSS